MATPSSLYAEDENARQTLANGTVLKWTKQLENIHALNAETDLSISYTNWANEPMMKRANRGFHQWQGGCVSGGDLGYNQSTGYTYQHATGIKQLESGQPRIDSLQTHVVLSNGGGYYVWGYNPESSTRISGSSGNQRRYLLDMDINKMIFNCTITVVDKSFFDNVDYATNPENMPAPSEHNITLKELYTHPELYYCTGTIVWANTYVYGEDTSDHWRGVAIRPSILLTGESIGEYQGADNSIFGTFTSNGSFSYDSRDPNGHANFGGGGSSNTLYNRMNSGYFMGCKNEIDMTPTDTFDSAGGMSTAIALDKWGNTNFSRFAYCNGQIFDYGDSVIWCAWGCRVVNNSDTGAIYRDYTFGTRRYIKADKMLKYIASFGLYFMSESFDPDTVSLTPETLGDDSRIMLGEMSADGTTTGRWITDIDSYHGPNKDGKTSNPDYDPSGGGGGGSDTDDMDLTEIGFTSSIGGAGWYWVFNGPPTGVFQDFNLHAPEGSMLSQNILSCYCSALNYDWHTVNQKMVIYTNGSQTPAYESTNSYPLLYNDKNPHFVVGYFDVPRQTNTFYDFNPYTTYELFIPFCGWIGLPDTVAGRAIRVYMDCDVATCTCKAIVMLESNDGETIIGEITGNFGAPCPIQVVEGGLYKQAAINSGLQIASGLASGLYGASAGAGALAISGFSNALQGIHNMHVAGNTNYGQTIGRAGDCSNLAGGHYCKIRITHPVIDEVVNSSIFGHTIGYLCNTVGKLSSFSGFTVCLNPHIIGIDCTDEEKEEIKGLLENGVIL